MSTDVICLCRDAAGGIKALMKTLYHRSDAALTEAPADITGTSVSVCGLCMKNADFPLSFPAKCDKMEVT